MRHRKSINHLGRKSAHREAMLSNMAASLIMHKRINTTLAKAKALRSYVEPLITRSKEDTTHNRRMVFSYLQNKEAVTELFRTISQKIADRPGGYTRILKTGTREGDKAVMCMIELVDYNETYLKDVKAGSDKGKTRRSRSKKKSEDSEVTPVKAKAPAKVVSEPAPETEVAEETPETVAEEVAEVTAEVTTEVVDETPAEDVPETPTEEKEKEE